MKKLTPKSVVFGLLFAVAACFLSLNTFAENNADPVKKISWYDGDEGAPGDTTDGGIRTPGPGH
jgi:hypothetical protein